MGLLSSVTVALVVCAADTPENARTELGILPVAGGDTDVGFGVGFIGSLARLEPGASPYRWRIEAAGFITFKKPADDGLISPYQDLFVLATLPGLMGGRLRLELRPSYTREITLRYYGLGNASSAPEPEVAARDFFRRTHPAVTARARFAVGHGLHALAAMSYVWNAIDFEPESTVLRDLEIGSERVRSLLLVDRRFGLHLIDIGLMLDRRDNEIATTRGQYHQIKLRVSSGGFAGHPYQYLQGSIVTRFYFSPVPDRLVIATRQVFDIQTGDLPFYELSRYAEDAGALGGTNGVRGVPGDRYYGKIKLFGNLEARLHLLEKEVFGSRYRLGVVAFVDGGRLWADTSSAPELDGTGLGLKVGVGGGLRLQKGETFVLRADIAWSPDARPLGGYFIGGHSF